jgi:hypothetical protein
MTPIVNSVMRVGYSLIDETDILSKDKMTEVFMKIIGVTRSILPLGHINQTDVVGTLRALNGFMSSLSKNFTNKAVIKAKTYDNLFACWLYRTLRNLPRHGRCYLN